MKKIFLFLAFVLTVSAANAWKGKCDEAVVIVATEHLNPKAKKLVKKCLGKDYADDVSYLYKLEKAQAKQLTRGERRAAAEIHYLHLDSNLQPKSVEGKDAFKATEDALVVIRNHKSHSKDEVAKALRTVINLMCDMHNLSKVRIDGIPHSFRNFKYIIPVTDFREKQLDKFKVGKWSRSFWNGFDGGYNFFSAEYWARDMRIYIGDRYEEYAKGTLRDWVCESGTRAAQYLEIFKPNQKVPYMDYLWAKPVGYEMMIKASCRLAKLLNETIE